VFSLSDSENLFRIAKHINTFVKIKHLGVIMKVFEVLVEANDRPHIARSGAGWKVTFPDGSEVSATSQEAANNLARQWSDANAPRGASNDVSSRTRPDGRIEPTLDRTPNADVDVDTPRTSITPGVRQGTPTTDSLSAGEKRRLARRGSITRRGVTYTRSQIAAADAEAARLRGSDVGRDVRPGDDRAASGDRNPQTPDADTPRTPQGFVRKVFGKIWKAVKVVLGPYGANAINAAINASAVEDSLDAYLRAVRDYAMSLESDTDRQRFLSDMENNRLPAGFAGAYTELVERMTQLILEAVIGILIGGVSSWGAIALLGWAGLSTGGIGLILGVIVGGGAAILGTNGAYRLLEEIGFNDIVESQLARRFFTTGALFDAAKTVDGWQEFWGANLDWIGAGDLVRDSMYIGEAEDAGSEKIDSKAAERKLKQIIKSNPELMQAYRDGKEEAKRILKAGPEES
jgi:hypothetical protein